MVKDDELSFAGSLLYGVNNGTDGQLRIADVVREVRDGVVIRVFLKPGARRRAIAGLHGGALKVKVESPPIEGKANSDLIDLISKILGVPRSDVTIASGERSRLKSIRVRGVSSGHVVGLLEGALEKDDLRRRSR